MADLECKQIGPVLQITLNRPDRMNALSADMREGLKQQFFQIEADIETSGLGRQVVRAVVLTGAGRGFCAGADLDVETMLARRAGIEQDLQNGMNKVIAQMQTLPVPIIAAVNGAAAGAGLGLALACDVLLASPQAKFHLAFARIGAVLDGGTSFFLSQALGPYRAKALALQGGSFSSEEAMEWGLVEAVHSDESLLEEALSKAVMLAQGPAVSQSLIKQQFLEASVSDLSDCLEAEARAQALAFQSEDFEIGVRAFADGAKPRFVGASS